MKIAGSGSGSISQRHGSADPDPDPHQNVTDPQHCFLPFGRNSDKKVGKAGGNLVAYDITSLILRETDLDLLDSFVRLESNVGHAGVHHEAEQIENEVGMAAQVEEGGVALPPELLVVGLAIKNHLKKNKKKTPKNPLKMGFFVVFLNFKFFMKIIQTFLFETDFL